MKIAHVTDFYLPRFGGLELQVADLAAQQAQRGHDVTVFTSTPPDETPDAPGVRVVRLTDDLELQHWLNPGVLRRGTKALRSGGFDAVHVHLGVGTPLAFWAARFAAGAGLPTLATVHSFWWKVHPVFRALDLAGGFTRLPIRWTAVSDAAAEPVRRIVGDQVDVLPNGTCVADWAVEPLPRPADQVVLAAVMRLARRKRALPLLEIAREVRERVPDDVRLRLVVVGDGPELPRMRHVLERSGMDAWVELAGRQERGAIRELYRSTDAFLAPADLESFGIAALEARCAGVPVLARRASGVATFVRHGVDGLLAADDAEMVDQLVELCTRPDLRRALQGAPPPVDLDWSTVVRATLDLYVRAGAPSDRVDAP